MIERAKTPTRELVEFLHALSLERVRSSTGSAAKRALLDTLGCAVFGAPESWSQIMAAEVIAEASKGRSTIIGRDEVVAAPAAALCNGTAAHGFELDDHLDEAIVHPGAIVVSAALAAAEACGASGERLLLALIGGYETLNRVGLAMGVKPSQVGWHKTAVAGPVGAALAASIAMKLDAEQMMNAVGLACATASGTKAFAAGEGGGMEKRMQAGHAAYSGVRAAQLAARGFTAPPSAVDGRFGLLDVMSGASAQPELLSSELGTRWAIEHVYVKLYPCCAWIQAAAQQLVMLRGAEALQPSQILAVQVGVSAYARAQNANPLPRDTMGAQFSIPYCVALALTADPGDPAMYAPEAIDDPLRRELARRVEIVIDPEMEAAYPKHYGARVYLELEGGVSRTSSKLDPHGMPADPCTEAEVLEKFRRLATRVKSEEDAQSIIKTVQRTERLQRITELTQLLKAKSA
jgi:2-methylcitrate dehydratase PrpD